MFYYVELILCGGEVCGYLLFGVYGYVFGVVIGFGYVFCEGESVVDVLVFGYEIEIVGMCVVVIVSFKFLYDLIGG